MFISICIYIYIYIYTSMYKIQMCLVNTIQIPSGGIFPGIEARRVFHTQESQQKQEGDPFKQRIRNGMISKHGANTAAATVAKVCALQSLWTINIMKHFQVFSYWSNISKNRHPHNHHAATLKKPRPCATELRTCSEANDKVLYHNTYMSCMTICINIFIPIYMSLDLNTFVSFHLCMNMLQ